MARIVRDSEAFGGGVGDDEDEDVTFMETDEVEDGGTVKRNPRMVTRTVAMGQVTPSFLSATDKKAIDYATQVSSQSQLPDARRNIIDVLEISEFQNEEGESAVILPAPSEAKETVRVFLRVKPQTEEEKQIWETSKMRKRASMEEEGDLENMVKIESGHQVAITAPRESNTYKNSMNGAGKLVHRYTFTRIFPPHTEQQELFTSMVLPRVQEFLEGQNQLLFTYGASSSGKTYTIQGEAATPGILPRALDVLFNSVKDRQMLGLELKPNCFNRVVHMKDKDIRKLEEDKHSVFALGMELHQPGGEHGGGHQSTASSAAAFMSETLESADVTNISQQSLATMFPRLANRVRDETSVDIKHHEIKYAVWISFAEIYNESIYDLLEKMPVAKRKGDKPPARPALKLAEDKNGSIYVRGLKEVKVNSADEAYQVMMIGRKNLHFAATRLNHHSSRSHCIFTIKTIRVAETAKPHLARVSMLSFCDLAGSERVKKAINSERERQKEAGNINTSLLVLGRCIKAIRHNQTLRDTKKHQIVPFRESKLTRMFQSFLVGHGKASMVVNISQAPYLFDESLQVLKFAAVAGKVTVVQKAETPETVKAKKRKVTRFSIMVAENNKSKTQRAPAASSILMGRGSIAWDKPTARSTMCPGMTSVAAAALPEQDTTWVGDETTVIEDDERYEGLLKLIDSLKDQLIKEKQEKLKMESEIRTELCDEFNKMMVEIETGWERRLQDEKERSKELNDWRLNKLEDAYNNKRKELREARKAAAKAGGAGGGSNETAIFQKDELEIMLEDRESEITSLKAEVEALRATQKSVSDEARKNKEEAAKKAHELAKTEKRLGDAEREAKEARKDAENAHAAKLASVENNSSEPVIEDLRRQLRELDDKRAELAVANANMKELLDEAEEDYTEKVRECERLGAQLKDADKQVMQQTLVQNELQAQLDESRQLLTVSAAREEELEKTSTELEERLEAAPSADEFELAKKQRDELEASLVEVKQQNVTYAREKAELLEEISQSKTKAESDRERVERELNDESEGLKSAKKELKQTLDERVKELAAKECEITRLEREVKSLLQAEKQQSDVNSEIKAEVEMLRKQIKDISAESRSGARAEVTALKKRVEDIKAEAETSRVQAEALRKEDGAFDILKRQLDANEAAKAKLEGEVKAARSEAEAIEYDLKRTRGEKEALMARYEQQIKAQSEDLAKERREAQRIREVMAKSTPTKTPLSRNSSKDSSNLLSSEVAMLREELTQKSEVIKKLEAVMTPRKNSKSDESDGGVEDEDKENRSRKLQMELVRLQKELDLANASHEKEMEKAKKGFEKLIAEYKEANLELQRRVPPSAARSTATVDPDADSSVLNSSEIIPASAQKSNRKKRKTRTTTNTTAASTSVESSMTTSNSSSKRTRQSRKRKTANSPSKTMMDSASQASFAADSTLDDDADEADAAADDSFVPSGRKPKRSSRVTATPSTAKRRQLYREPKGSVAPEAFTPPMDLETSPMTPKTIVKRQLRSRSRKN